MRAVSLMYHDVVSPGAEEESGFPGGHSRIYKLHTELFSAHLDAVAASGASVCNDVRALTAASRPPVLFTFDDGGVSFLDPIAGMLEARGWRGHFFITTGRVGSPGFLTAAQVRELARRGHIVGSHSVHHPTRMAELPAAHMSEEWTESRKALADLLGAAVDTASVPGGYYSRQVAVSAADAGFGHLFHSEPLTRVDTTGPLRLYGRFAFLSSSSASLAGRLAQDDAGIRARFWTIRQVKTLAKKAGGDWLVRLHARRLNGPR